MFSVFKAPFQSLVPQESFQWPQCPQHTCRRLLTSFHSSQKALKIGLIVYWENESACNYVVSSTFDHTQFEVAIFHIKVQIKRSNTGNCSHGLYTISNAAHCHCECFRCSMILEVWNWSFLSPVPSHSNGSCLVPRSTFLFPVSCS